MKIKDENFQKITLIKSKFAYLTNYLITLCFIKDVLKIKKADRTLPAIEIKNQNLSYLFISTI